MFQWELSEQHSSESVTAHPLNLDRNHILCASKVEFVDLNGYFIIEYAQGKWIEWISCSGVQLNNDRNSKEACTKCHSWPVYFELLTAEPSDELKQ